MRQTVPGVVHVSSVAPHPHVSRPGTLQMPPTDPIDGLTEAGQPSMQVEPDPQAPPGTQLLNGPPSFAASSEVDPLVASDDLPSIAASATGRHVQVFGTGSYPAAQSGKHLLDLQPGAARTAASAPVKMRVARTRVADCK
jgi:hypothetical protein